VHQTSAMRTDLIVRQETERGTVRREDRSREEREKEEGGRGKAHEDVSLQINSNLILKVQFVEVNVSEPDVPPPWLLLL
jgi:hypothetical protein